MLNRVIIALSMLVCFLPALHSQAATQRDAAPIYNVTVVDRTTKAINYQYRRGPTKIDFRGTVLLPHGKGEATVESKQGRTEIDAKFENLTPPSAYGREFLTYTLWAVTPEGATRNLGEIIPGTSNKAKLHVTTDLQAFGLIVTAEPYSAGRTPSAVVVMENEIRPDTLGSSQPINVKYELMPREHYTWQVPDQMDASVANMPKVSMSEYEELLAIYEAQNAIGIANSAGAGTYAGETLRRAQAELAEAQRLHTAKGPLTKIVQNARAAAETAEDARVIAERRQHQLELTAAKYQAQQAEKEKQQAQAQTQKALAEAQAARAEIESQRAAMARAQAAARNADASMRVATVAPPPPVAARPVAAPDAQKLETRGSLLNQLSAVLPTRDTPLGIVVTIADPNFEGADLSGRTAGQVARVAAILSTYAGLTVDVEGFSDSLADSSATARAEAVRGVLISRGMSRAAVTARGMGDTRLLASNETERGRERNRRVEIVISGGPIGPRATWDRPNPNLSAGSAR